MAINSRESLTRPGNRAFAYLMLVSIFHFILYSWVHESDILCFNHMYLKHKDYIISGLDYRFSTITIPTLLQAREVPKMCLQVFDNISKLSL